MAARNLILANGQLGTTAATLLSGAAAPSEGLVNVVLNNTGTNEETILLTLQVRGDTARRIARIVLQENQAAHVRGIPLGFEDTLLAVTTTASVVDHLVTVGDGSLRVEVLSADGSGKGLATLRRMLFGMELAHGDELPDPG